MKPRVRRRFVLPLGPAVRGSLIVGVQFVGSGTDGVCEESGRAPGRAQARTALRFATVGPPVGERLALLREEAPPSPALSRPVLESSIDAILDCQLHPDNTLPSLARDQNR